MLGAQEVIILGLLVAHVIPLWFVCRKAGFSGAWSLFSIVPILGLPLVLIVLASAEWPSLRIAPAPSRSAGTRDDPNPQEDAGTGTGITQLPKYPPHG